MHLQNPKWIQKSRYDIDSNFLKFGRKTKMKRYQEYASVNQRYFISNLIQFQFVISYFDFGQQENENGIN